MNQVVTSPTRKLQHLKHRNQAHSARIKQNSRSVDSKRQGIYDLIENHPAINTMLKGEAAQNWTTLI